MLLAKWASNIFYGDCTCKELSIDVFIAKGLFVVMNINFAEVVEIWWHLSDSKYGGIVFLKKIPSKYRIFNKNTIKCISMFEFF